MNFLHKTAMAFAAAGSIAAVTAPAVAADFHGSASGAVYAEQAWNHGHGRGHRGYYEGRDYGRRYTYDNDRRDYRRASWRGRDGRTYCRRSDGTTGLLIGGAAGGLLGHEIAGRGDRTLGTVLGVAGGALLGREIDRGGSRCR